jgi:hypothetical protein
MRELYFTSHLWAKALCLIALLMAATSARAQYSSGIEASVTDQSGAVIPNAQATLTNQDTQVSQSATSNSLGLVRILHLPPGRYRISVTAPGFAGWEQTDIVIEGTDIRTVYPKLNVGTA